MTKQELVRAISHETGVDQPTALVTVEAFMNIIKDAMAQGENVYLRGFGTFNLKKRAAKTARNITKKRDHHRPRALHPRLQALPRVSKQSGRGKGAEAEK